MSFTAAGPAVGAVRLCYPHSHKSQCCHPGSPDCFNQCGPHRAAPTKAEPAPTTAPPDAARVILVAPNGTDQGLGQAVSKAVADLAGKDSLAVSTVKELSAGDLTPAVKVAVLVGAPQNMDQLLQAGPKTQFLVVGSGDLPQKAANLSVISQKAEDQAFMAGYLAELISNRLARGGPGPFGRAGWGGDCKTLS